MYIVKSSNSPKSIKSSKYLAKDQFPDWAIDVALKVRNEVTVAQDITFAKNRTDRAWLPRYSIDADHKEGPPSSKKQKIRSPNEVEPSNSKLPIIKYYPPPSKLFTTSSQLRLSAFEMRLLHFFQHYCIPLFRRNADEKLSSVWNNEIPMLWSRSKLFRMSVYLYSAMNLWPLCDLQSLVDSALIDEDRLFLEISKHNNNQYGVIIDPEATPKGGNLYINTIEYFGNSLRLNIESISKITAKGGGEVPAVKSAEVLVSGILIYSFLGMHPHRVAPLVSFDNESTDLLRICDGLRVAYISNIHALLKSPYSGIFRSDECMEPTSALKYPIIENMRYRLKDEVDSEYYETFKTSIDLLEICMYRAVTLKYAVPLFRWILMQDVLHEIVRSKNEFGLKILFTFASLCNVCRFHLFSKANMWLDFMEWYRDFNYEKYGKGVWKNMDDFLLYRMVVEHRMGVVSAEDLGTLDPYVSV